MYLYLNIFIAIGLTWHCKVSKVASLQARFIDNHNLGVRCPYVDENWYKKNILLFYIFVFLHKYSHTCWSYLTLQVVKRSILTSQIHWHPYLEDQLPLWWWKLLQTNILLFFVPFLYLDLNINITISLIWHCKVSKEASW